MIKLKTCCKWLLNELYDRTVGVCSRCCYTVLLLCCVVVVVVTLCCCYAVLLLFDRS